MVSANPAAWDQLRGFAAVQAVEANAALGVLDERLARAESRGERVAAFETAYRHVAEWRYQVALGGQWTRPGASADDVKTPIGPGGMGYRVTPDEWLPDRESPAFKMLAKLATVGLERLNGSSRLQNRVDLRNGRQVDGNALQLVPGPPDEVQTRTAEPDDREVLRRASFEALAELDEARAAGGTDPKDPEQRQMFVDAAYFMVQGPEFKRGSDAIMRTFLATAHTRVFDAAPVLPQAIDLDGMVRGQEGFNQVMHEQLRIAAPSAAQPVVDAGSERTTRTSLNRGGGLTR